MGFFDDYPAFYDEEGGINSFPNRLNLRYRALIESNRRWIENRRILDIGCFDGRWAFAALKGGAKHVLGFDIIPGAVKQALQRMDQYDVARERYHFRVGDIHSELRTLEPGQIDTVFCFGFFYHTLRHIELLEAIERLKPSCLIFDTTIDTSGQPVIRLHYEDVVAGGPKSRVNPTVGDRILVGWPSRSAVIQLIEQFGFSCEVYDWFHQDIEDWSHMSDYQSRQRITLVALPRDGR